jgi:hypothetical protein
LFQCLLSFSEVYASSCPLASFSFRRSCLIFCEKQKNFNSPHFSTTKEKQKEEEKKGILGSISIFI